MLRECPAVGCVWPVSKTLEQGQHCWLLLPTPFAAAALMAATDGRVTWRRRPTWSNGWRRPWPGAELLPARPVVPARPTRLCFRPAAGGTSGLWEQRARQPCSDPATARFPHSPMAFLPAESCWRWPPSWWSDQSGAAIFWWEPCRLGGVGLGFGPVNCSKKEKKKAIAAVAARAHASTLLQAGDNAEGLLTPRWGFAARPAQRSSCVQSRSIFEIDQMF